MKFIYVIEYDYGMFGTEIEDVSTIHLEGHSKEFRNFTDYGKKLFYHIFAGTHK